MRFVRQDRESYPDRVRGNLICDDEDQYVLFSFGRNSCSRNRRKYTLCGFHGEEGHEGNWQDCPECREHMQTEIYVWYGTNKYNFEKLKNPPTYKPTKCAKCKKVIRLTQDGYTVTDEGYLCARCFR